MLNQNYKVENWKTATNKKTKKTKNEKTLQM